ncbi:MAG: hypothetical protein IPJ77_24220 [Planctomycetes bacterium]|nr:hypothetical protein [Planctomycetota bacterium]
MKHDCALFRAELERRLGDARDAAVAELGWHEHLLSCSACRALLEAEEALDVLLASLPEPRLPRRLAERLLVRLREARSNEDELDQLLALDAHASPAGLAERVAAGVRAREAREERALDVLLDRVPAPAAPIALGDRVLARLVEPRAAAERALDRALEHDAPPAVPAELGARVLAKLADARSSAAARSNARVDRAASDTHDRIGAHRTPAEPARLAAAGAPRAASAEVQRAVAPARPRTTVWSSRRTWVWAAAASVIVALAVWLAWSRARPFLTPAPIVRDTAPRRENVGPRVLVPERAVVDAPNEEVLAALDVLEQWELLMKDDVDVLLSTIAPADESLLEVDEAAPVDEAPAEGETKPEGKKG